MAYKEYLRIQLNDSNLTQMSHFGWKRFRNDDILSTSCFWSYTLCPLVLPRNPKYLAAKTPETFP